MHAVSEFFPQVQFSPMWTIIGLLIGALVIVWFVVVIRLTRARPIPPPPATDLGFIAPELRSKYVALIDEVAAAHGRFEITVREAHQRLSSIIRAFAHELSGYPTSSMTLTELKGVNLPKVSGAVERLYPTEFKPQATGSVTAAVAEAKKVVLEWR